LDGDDEPATVDGVSPNSADESAELFKGTYTLSCISDIAYLIKADIISTLCLDSLSTV
jgi:hypothetical protein